MLEAEGLAYETSGDGEAVLLIHGSHITDAFLPLMREAALADRYRLIRYRRRGFAGSAEMSGAFSIEQQAQDALALLTHLGVERVHVVGHSYGGVIGIQLAIDAPSLVRSLVVLEPAIMSPDTSAAFFEPAAPFFEAYGSGDHAKAVDLFLTAVSAADWRSAVENTVPGGPEQAEKDARTFFEVEVPALQEWVFDVDRAGRIAQPILHVIGSESGPLFEANKQHFQSLVPHAEHALVPGVNHMMQMQDPKLVAAPIADFLSRQPR
jgi:pimeloyl-ACP methyl ester carboxylesterase